MAIVLDNITYTYGMGTPFEKTALRGVSLTIENGEFLGVIGHTGSGKSTFVQHLNGLLHPTTGTVTVNGVDISASTEEAKKMRHKVGMVFQYPEHQLFEETIAHPSNPVEYSRSRPHRLRYETLTLKSCPYRIECRTSSGKSRHGVSMENPSSSARPCSTCP